MVAKKAMVVDVSEIILEVIVMEIGKREGARVPEAESAEVRCYTLWVIQFWDACLLHGWMLSSLYASDIFLNVSMQLLRVSA